jgi:hypothetical protein
MDILVILGCYLVVGMSALTFLRQFQSKPAPGRGPVPVLVRLRRIGPFRGFPRLPV